MTPITKQIADMVDMLPERDQTLSFEVIKKMVLAWDSDFIKTTAAERAHIDKAEAEIDAGDYISGSSIVDV